MQRIKFLTIILLALGKFINNNDYPYSSEILASDKYALVSILVFWN